MRGSTVIAQEDYTYPAAGQAHCDQIAVKQVTRLTTSGTESFFITYAYDGLNRLTAMNTYAGSYGDPDPALLASESWTFDSLGNRTDLTSDIMNQYTEDEDAHDLTYDARGNLTDTYDFAYAYDQCNRLISAKTPRPLPPLPTFAKNTIPITNVAYDGGMEKDILGDYVLAAFTKAGFTNRNEPDSRYYHNFSGNIHCGTNVRRDIPAYKWWED